MTESENQVYQSIKYWHRIKDALVGDRIEDVKKKIGHGLWRSRKKQICDFWILGNGYFCGLEVKATYGDEFDVTKSAPTQYQLMNLRKIERHGGASGMARGYFLIQFVSVDGVEWYALRVPWMDKYMKENGRQQIPKEAIAQASVDPLAHPAVMRLRAEHMPTFHGDILDLRPLIAEEN